MTTCTNITPSGGQNQPIYYHNQNIAIKNNINNNNNASNNNKKLQTLQWNELQYLSVRLPASRAIRKEKHNSSPEKLEASCQSFIWRLSNLRFSVRTDAGGREEGKSGKENGSEETTTVKKAEEKG